jgi:hypothetical protein
MNKKLIYIIVLFASCTASEKPATDNTTFPDSSSLANTSVVQANTSADNAIEQKPETADVINTEVALEFINDYVKHLNSGDPFDRMSWVENNELATDEFKASYKKLFTEAFEDDPEAGLDYDPILNAQDTPVGFEFVRLEDNEYVVMKGTDQPQFTNVLRVRFVVDRWLVEGTGVVNIPEQKRGLK